MSTKTLTSAVLRGIGQVFLQNNQITGIIFLVGIFCASWQAGIAAIMGSFIGTKTAELMGYNQEDIEDGLYGYNAVLSAIAIMVFFKFTLITLITLVLSSIASTLIMRSMHKRGWYPYTFPFVLSSWIFIAGLKVFHVAEYIPLNLFQATAPGVLYGITRGFSQVMLLGSVLTGVIFLVGILFNSFKSGLYALLGSIVGFTVAAIIFPNMYSPILLGFFGFNAALCGIAFAERKPNSMVFAIIAMILSVFIMRGFMWYSILGLTAPFVFSVWISARTKKVLHA